VKGKPLDVLLVEDDTALRETLLLAFAAEPWRVRWSDDGEAALAACAEALPDVVVLDVMLPRRSGIEVCAALRALYHPSPGVVMVTARDSELDVILGFEVGADDYVIKPCRPREIVARVKALSRRLTSAPSSSEPLLGDGLSLDPTARRVMVGNQVVHLTPTEFELLLCLSRAPDKVFSRLELLELVFDTKYEGYARNVDHHIKRLRKKLEAAGLSPDPIHTVHGAGYRFAPTRSGA
jgi:two-component system, OmpR family, response regulator MtrA